MLVRVLRIIALALLCCWCTGDVFGVLWQEEPCAITEQSGRDTSCSPSCVTCACCTQVREITTVTVVEQNAPVAADIPHTVVTAPLIAPRKIPHIPKAA
jgi:hypothetical protein